jgi:type II secretory pathway pseudopilin PulG
MLTRMPAHSRKALLAFKRIDLIVLVAIASILGALMFAVVARSRERARRAHCQNNLAQIDKALQLYADDNENLLPDCTRKNPEFFGTAWPWDLTTNLVDQLELRGARRSFLYCPSNSRMDNDADWNYWKYHGGQNRIIGYALFLNGNVPDAPNVWHRSIKGDGLQSAAQTELVVDAVISASGNYVGIQASQTRRTSHLVAFGKQPAGGNIAFEDGHVEWKVFNLMQSRFFTRGFNPVDRTPISVDWYY